MAYQSLNPKTNSLILTDITSTTPANPASGTNKLVNRSGSIYVRSSAGTEVQLLSGSSGYLASAKSADYAVTDTDNILTVLMTTSSTNRTVSLPAAANNTNRILYVKKVDSGTGQVIVDGNASETIDGALTKLLVEQYDYIEMVCDGSNWHIVDMNGTTQSLVRVETGNGHGSTNTRIRRFTTSVIATGNAITYADSATLGATFTVNQDGIYSIHYSERTSSDGDYGISLNSVQLTTDVGSITNTTRLAYSYLGIGASSTQLGGMLSVTTKLSAADVVRAHTDTSANGTNARTAFSIARIKPC